MPKVKESLRSVYSHKADRISQTRNSISKSLNLLILKQDTPAPNRLKNMPLNHTQYLIPSAISIELDSIEVITHNPILRPCQKTHCETILKSFVAGHHPHGITETAGRSAGNQPAECI